MSKNRSNRRRPSFAISGSGPSARVSVFARRTSQRRDVIGFELSPFSVLLYGIGGLWGGGTPQMAHAQGGRGGTRGRLRFPFPAGGTLGSFVGSPVFTIPLKLSLLWLGRVYPC